MNGVGNAGEPLDGFQVITPNGRTIGEVAGVSEATIVVRMRRFGRSTYRPLPRELALVWHRNRVVVAQLSARDLRDAPALPPDRPVDETTVTAFWRAHPPR